MEKKMILEQYLTQSIEQADDEILEQQKQKVDAKQELKQILNEITDMELNVTEDFEGGPDGVKEIEETTQPKSTL